MISNTTELEDFVAKNNIPAIIDKILLIIIAPFLPSLSANHDPPSEPVAPPIRNMETMDDHKKLSCPVDKTAS